MFSAIRKVLERRKLKSILGRYIDEADLETILADESPPKGLTSCEFTFVLLELRSIDRETLEPHFRSAIELAATHSGMVDTMVSNLMVVHFGTQSWSPPGGHKVFIESALAKFGSEVRIAYSTGLGHVGNLGSAKLMYYAFIHPAFPRTLAELVAMPYGEAHEVS